MFDLNRTQQMTDIIHGTISYSGLEGAIVSSPIFNRLHRILQSSLVYLTFSSNKVKRFEHSIGVMYLAGEIFYHSFTNTSNNNELINTFLIESEAELINWYNKHPVSNEKILNPSIIDKYEGKRILTAPIPNSTLYREYLPENISVEHRFIYLVMFQSVRLAGLLHDVGHLPYSHVFEYATKLLYSMVDDITDKNDGQKDFVRFLEPYCTGNEEIHEQLGYSLLEQIKFEIAEEIVHTNQISEKNLFLMSVWEFTKKILTSKLTDNNIFSDLHRIISGILDADRLDYCSRDAYCAGVQKDIFPYQRLLKSYKLVSKPLDIDIDKDVNRNRILFCPAAKNISDVEELLERRWKIFNQINYHHRVHKHEIIFSEVIANIGLEELNNLNGEIPKLVTGVPLPLCMSSIWWLIYQLSSQSKLIDYLVIQLDDSWMDTLLKVHFFEKYGQSFRDIDKYKSDPLWNMFDELISAKKHYYSVYKRNTDFLNFDTVFGSEWLKQNENSTDKVKKGLVATLQRKVSNKEKIGFSFNAITTALVTNKVLFYQKIEKQINEYLVTEEGKTLNILHCLMRPCDFNLGCYNVGAPVYLWDNNDVIHRAEAISIKDEQLKSQQKSNVPFHLYYLPDNPAKPVNIELLEKHITSLILTELVKIYPN